MQDKNTHILIVEDESISSKYLKNILNTLGFHNIHQASNAEESIQIVKMVNIHLCFMDINIEGGIDGIQCSFLLNQQYSIPIIFTTSHADSNTILDAKDTNVFGYLIKPFHANNVEATLQIVLKRIHEKSSALKQNLNPVSFVDLQNGQKYNIETQTFTLNNESISLTQKERSILTLLCQNLNQNISYEILREKIWKPKIISNSTIRDLFSRLKRKLPKLQIDNIRNFGYVLKAKDTTMNLDITQNKLQTNIDEIFALIKKTMKTELTDTQSTYIQDIEKKLDVVTSLLDINITKNTIQILQHDCKNIDTQKGISYINGDVKFYIELLEDFYQKYKDFTFDNLSTLELQRTAHSIKGLASTIGAIKLSDISKQIEQTSNHTLFDIFYKELHKVLKDIESLPTSKNINALIEISSQKRDELFSLLKESIFKRRSKKCKEILKELLLYKLCNEDKKILDQIEELVKKRDYKKMHNLLIKLD